MTKADMIRLLEPFADDMEIFVTTARLPPLKILHWKYLPATPDSPTRDGSACIVLRIPNLTVESELRHTIKVTDAEPSITITVGKERKHSGRLSHDLATVCDHPFCWCRD